MNVTILKIGGSVITNKKAVPPHAKKEEIKRTCREIAAFIEDSEELDRLILVHGAGSFGHPQAKIWIEKLKYDKKGIFLIHDSVKTLNSIFMDALNKVGVPSIPVHPMSCFLLDNNKIIDFQSDIIKTMLKQKIVPVLHGDIVMDKTLGASILSGDKIVTYISLIFENSKIGSGTDVNGVMDENGKVIKKITPQTFMSLKPQINGSVSSDVTGGMHQKVYELVEIAKKGKNSRIFNASKKGMIEKFLYGEPVGTLISDE